MRNIVIIRNIMTSLAAIAVLTWAFPRNQIFGKLIITPFLICSIAYLGENVFLLFHQEKISNLFKFVFRMSFFLYVFGFLFFALYYSLVNTEYSLIPLVIVFAVFILYFFKAVFFRK